MLNKIVNYGLIVSALAVLSNAVDIGVFTLGYVVLLSAYLVLCDIFFILKKYLSQRKIKAVANEK